MSTSVPAFDLLCNHIVGNGTRANYHARMNPKGSARKYTYVKRYTGPDDKEGEHLPITDDEIRAHLAGDATYTVRLIGTDGLVSAALIELDADHLEGARRVQRAAAARNVAIVSVDARRR
jgi:hypothetical protein